MSNCHCKKEVVYPQHIHTQAWHTVHVKCCYRRLLRTDCHRGMWQSHVAGPCDRATWQLHVAGPCGRAMWQCHVHSRTYLPNHLGATTLYSAFHFHSMWHRTCGITCHNMRQVHCSAYTFTACAIGHCSASVCIVAGMIHTLICLKRSTVTPDSMTQIQINKYSRFHSKPAYSDTVSHRADCKLV
jgi:hypothetical protein